MLLDLRYALRQLRKSPAFTAVAVLTLALGIGANTAIFSVINSALLQPLPYPHAEQLVDIMEMLSDGRPNGSVSGGAFKDWREHSSKFAHLAVYEDTRRNLTGMGSPERVTGLQVSAEFLSVLGVAPMVGRGFAVSETAAGGNNQVILLTHQFWQSHYGGDAGVVGSKVSLDQTPYTVIGVLPPRALLQDEVQFLVPEVIDAPGTYWGRDLHWRRVVGRLLPGITASEAQTELRGIKQRLAAEYPSFKKDWSVLVTPLQEIFVRGTRPMFVLLLGAVALVLLIACANVSNLMLAARQRAFERDGGPDCLGRALVADRPADADREPFACPVRMRAGPAVRDRQHAFAGAHGGGATAPDAPSPTRHPGPAVFHSRRGRLRGPVWHPPGVARGQGGCEPRPEGNGTWIGVTLKTTGPIPLGGVRVCVHPGVAHRGGPVPAQLHPFAGGRSRIQSPAYPRLRSVVSPGKIPAE
jgi:hypothetical protein